MSVENLQGEIWKDVVIDSETYPYQISSFGRIKSLNFNHTGEERLMKTTKDKDGYLTVGLRRNGERQKRFKIHRLLAIAFLPTIEGKSCVNHKIEGEEGKSMNFVFFKADGSVDEERTSIEWVSHKENSNYGSCIARTVESRKTSVAWKETRKINGAKKSKQVYQYNQDFQLINIFPSTMEVERQYGFNHRSISACCLKKGRKTVGGFIWSYEPIETSSNQLTLFPLTTKKIS